VSQRRADSGRTPNDGDGRFRVSPGQIGAIALAVIALVLVLQNTNRVQVNLLFWDVTMRLWVLLLVMLALGAVIGSLLRWRGRRRS
jgi:uncharacterized integral membrane protein